jgi:peroxiredoxin
MPALQNQLDSLSADVMKNLSTALSASELKTFKAQFESPASDSPFPPARVGQTAPQFTCTNQRGERVSVSDLISSGRHTVLVWYRGEWCPWCSLTLKTHNEHVAQYRALNAELYAITPTLPAVTAGTVQKMGLTFDVLSDVGNTAAKAYGTLNQLNEDLTKVHQKMGVDFSKTYGNETHTLPHPGTFIVEAKTGRIAFARVDHDYRKRAEPEEIIAALKQLTQ